MAASLIHLVRHGEVHNPTGVLYGRLAGFHLSELGHRMADAAAVSLDRRSVSAVYASPLQRAQESAAPFSDRFGLDIRTDDRLIEPWNNFEGSSMTLAGLLRRPSAWPWVRNPWTPSWGEPYVDIAGRMIAAIDDVYGAEASGEVVLVSHQLPIVMVQRAAGGRKLYHDARRRRCSLSSITTFARRADAAAGDPRYVEVDYREPAADLLAEAIDRGAV